MPSGSMLPHGSADRRMGVPTCRDHLTAPVAPSRAYTVSFSVAAYTVPPMYRGCPYTAPSSAACQPTASVPSAGRSAATPVRALSRWYVGQSPGAPAAALLGAGAAVRSALGRAAALWLSPQPPSASA